MKKITLVFMLMAFVLTHADAKVWRVNNSLGVQADFTTLMSAVAGAAAGDTLYLEGSATNYDGATINKKLTLIGPGYYLSDAANTKTQWDKNSATVGHLDFALGSAGSKCAGLYMNSYQYLDDQYITIERCYVSQIIFGHGNNINCDHDTVRQCVIGAALTCQSTGGTFSAQQEMVYNNLIYGGVDFINSPSNVSVYFINNDFLANAGSFRSQNCVYQNNIFNNPFFSAYGTSNYFTNNVITSSSAGSGIATGNNNLFGVAWNTLMVTASPNFYTPPSGFSHDGQFQLKAGSAAVGAGTINGTTIDCGAFGGAAPYVLSGMPNIPSIYALSVPQQVNNGTATINISLSSAAH